MASFLSTADLVLMSSTARGIWDTQRLALGSPVATILRYTEYPSPETLSATVIGHSDLAINEDIVGRSLNLVEGNLDSTYTVTGYTATSITVIGANFLIDGFSLECTFHIDAIAYQKKVSPTLVQVLIVEAESLINREVAYYNLTEKELQQFNNELNILDKRFVFYDIRVTNDDIIIQDGQEYSVYKIKYNPIYGTMVVYGKAIRNI